MQPPFLFGVCHAKLPHMIHTYGNATPILRSFNQAEARAFYVNYLGFEVEFEHRFEEGLPLYMGLRNGTCTLHLSEHHGDASPCAHIRIGVLDVRSLCDTLRQKDYLKLRPSVEEAPWGGEEMTLTDPFSNRLTFYNQET